MRNIWKINKTSQNKQNKKQLPAGFVLRQATRCYANATRAPDLVSFMKPSILLCFEIAVSSQVGSRQLISIMHLLKSTMYIINISATNFAPIFKPKFLQPYTSVSLNNKKKVSTFLWLTLPIWPRFPGSCYHAGLGTLGVASQSYFWLLCPIYDNSIHSPPESHTSHKWKPDVKQEHEMRKCTRCEVYTFIPIYWLAKGNYLEEQFKSLKHSHKGS